MFYNFCKRVVWVWFHILYRIEVNGMENLPDEGAIICPNHFSLKDPLLICIMFPKQVRFMAKHELFNNPLLRWFLLKIGTYPIKRGETDLTAIKTTLKILKDDCLVGLFPEGTRSLDGKLGEANPGVALFSIKSGKPVVPVAIVGKYKLFSKLKINIGQPIDFKEYKKDKMTNHDYSDISQIVMEHIGRLRGDN